MGSVMDPYRCLRCFKKLLDPYSLLVRFIGFRMGSVMDLYNDFVGFKKSGFT